MTCPCLRGGRQDLQLGVVVNFGQVTGVLEPLAEGVVRGSQSMFGKYKLRIGVWQLFVGELVSLIPQFARR